MRSPLWVPALLLSGVLGLLAAAITRAMQGPPRRLPSMLYPWSEPVMDWEWWEHASYVAGVGSFAVSLLALVIAVVAGWIAWQQLHHQIEEIRRDQRRIADELNLRPIVTAEIAGHVDGVRWLSGTRLPGSLDVYRADLQVFVGNEGGRTARNVGLNITLAPRVGRYGLQLSGQGRRSGSGSDAGDRRLALQVVGLGCGHES